MRPRWGRFRVTTPTDSGAPAASASFTSATTSSAMRRAWPSFTSPAGGPRADAIGASTSMTTKPGSLGAHAGATNRLP